MWLQEKELQPRNSPREDDELFSRDQESIIII